MYTYEPANSDFASVGHAHKAEFVSFKLILSTSGQLPFACGQHHLEVSTRVIKRIKYPTKIVARVHKSMLFLLKSEMIIDSWKVRDLHKKGNQELTERLSRHHRV